MKPSMLFYMRPLCACLGALDNYDERALIRRMILRIDALASADRI